MVTTPEAEAASFSSHDGQVQEAELIRVVILVIGFMYLAHGSGSPEGHSVLLTSQDACVYVCNVCNVSCTADKRWRSLVSITT